MTGDLFDQLLAPPPAPRQRRKWTEEQRRGIETTGHSLLVSAAAGSGKTSVLAERCAYLVCDAPDPCDVDELLVVTFTEAAAAEMKGRIHAALRDRAAEAPSPRLVHQLALMDHAHVSTLHAFCSRVLRQHFHLVGIDPTFSVLDAEEAKLLRTDIARQLIIDRFELDHDGSFARFIDAYGDGNDERIARLIASTHEMLGSLRDPDAWMHASLERIEQAVTGPLLESELGRELMRLIESRLDGLIDRCGDVSRRIGASGTFPKYLAQLQEHAETLHQWRGILRRSGIDALAEAVEKFEISRLVTEKTSLPGREAAKAAIESVRKEIKEGTWRNTLRFTTADWVDGLKRVLPHAKLFLDLVRQFGDRYRREKDSARTVDFSDLERLTLKALRDATRSGGIFPTRVALSYHRRFRHVLVDEYQDINEVQDAILSLLSRECLGESKESKDEVGRMKDEEGESTFNSSGPSCLDRHASSVAFNLFCVGDVKQSIYRFRLAEPGQFLARQSRFQDDAFEPRRGELITLQANFRSRPALLEAINCMFERLMTSAAADIDYDASHRLRPGLQFPPADGAGRCFSGAPIELHLMPAKLGPAGEAEEAGSGEEPGADRDRTEREAQFVAMRIQQLLGVDGSAPACVVEKDATGEMRPRPIECRDIVVLLRAMKHKANVFADALGAAGIPAHTDGGAGFFETNEIRDMLSLLRLLDNQRQDIPLATLLRSPLGEMPEPENAFARIRLAYPEPVVAFHEAAARYATEQDDELAAKLRDLFAQLRRWRELAQRRPLAELISTIFDQTGYLAYCGALHGGDQRVANLELLHDRARQFGTFHRQGLSRFLEFLQNLQDEADLAKPSVATEAQNVVRVMSVHGSKGLEFPVVILPDLGKGINMLDCQGPVLVDRRAGLGMAAVDEHRQVRYPSLASTLVINRIRQQALAEELRVLYVAMTRAKEHLVLLGSCSEKSPEKWSARWAGHEGPLPPDEVLSARCMLDWLGPVAAMTGDAVFNVITHTADEVKAWSAPQRVYAKWTPKQERLARLEPLEPPPPADPTADEVIRRLTRQYPFAPFTKLTAATSATASKTRDPLHASPAPEAGRSTLGLPRFLAGDCGPAATEVGTATHLLLEHVDLRGSCDLPGLREQADELVRRRLMTPAQRDCIDYESVAWVMDGEVGQLMREPASRLMREAPIYQAITADESAPPADPLDQVMLRGRLDALVLGKDESVIIDYKTDRVTAEEVPARAESYRPQLASYGKAVEVITGKRAAEALLVFLKPRIVWRLAISHH